MTPQQIIDDALLLDKSITISFPTRKEFNSLRSQLFIYMKRMSTKSISMGFGDMFEGKKLHCIPHPKALVDGKPAIVYTISLQEPAPPEFHYQILQVA